LIPIEGTDKMQIGYSLMPEFWGKGYATELTIEGLKYVFTKTSSNYLWSYGRTQYRFAECIVEGRV
jgi:RimJ/RimL family protein N-acetyltransferase